MRQDRAPDKPLAWLYGEVKTPPFSGEARRRAGVLLRMLQAGRSLSMPDSRPMPSVGSHCCELRVDDLETRRTWRILCRIDGDAIVILDVFMKKTRKTPKHVIDQCKRRLRLYDSASD
jgi:phage-related protein